MHVTLFDMIDLKHKQSTARCCYTFDGLHKLSRVGSVTVAMLVDTERSDGTVGSQRETCDRRISAETQSFKCS